ncbi:MAG: hypothetical protein DME18_16950 [Verrucomicrobia bacterium]|nr:MAG: hypothetical protein DME18_16950 [Verrucomicrobiota bacterium]
MGHRMESAYFRRLRAAFLGACCLAGALVRATGVTEPVAPAQTPKQLTLSEARRLAFLNNWDLLAARSDIDMATAQKIMAREFPNPMLSLSSMKINVDGHPNGTPSGNGVWERSYDTLIAVNQLFEIGGKRSSRQASAMAGYAGARGRLLDARRQLGLAVTRAYIAALQAESDAQILQQSSQSLRQEAQIAQTRLGAGDISKSEESNRDCRGAVGAGRPLCGNHRDHPSGCFGDPPRQHPPERGLGRGGHFGITGQHSRAAGPNNAGRTPARSAGGGGGPEKGGSGFADAEGAANS